MLRGILNEDTNLRTGPSIDFKSRAKVGKNRGVEILDSRSEREWVRVRVIQGDYSGLVGWMHRDNIDMDKSLSSSGCFPGDVLVHTPNGLRRIVELKAGDEVLTYSTRSHRTSIRRVKRKKHYAPSTIINLTFGDCALPLRVTGSHSLLSESGSWRKARDLSIGDSLLTIWEGSIRSKKIIAVSSCDLAPVFNLIVEDNYTFIVDEGYVAHSYSYARWIRMTFLNTLASLKKWVGPSVKIGSKSYAHFPYSAESAKRR